MAKFKTVNCPIPFYNAPVRSNDSVTIMRFQIIRDPQPISSRDAISQSSICERNYEIVLFHDKTLHDDSMPFPSHNTSYFLEYTLFYIRIPLYLLSLDILNFFRFEPDISLKCYYFRKSTLLLLVRKLNQNIQLFEFP